jgi:hypothetical protein
MLGAVLWAVYGLLLQAPPVVAANLLVLGAASAASWRERRTSFALNREVLRRHPGV